MNWIVIVLDALFIFICFFLRIKEKQLRREGKSAVFNAGIFFGVFSLLTLLLFAVDRYMFFVSKWVVIASLCASLSAGAVFIVRLSSIRLRLMTLAFAVALTVSAASGIMLNPYFNSYSYRLRSAKRAKPYYSRLSSGEALADLDLAVEYLEKDHPALADGLTEEMEKKYAEARSEIAGRGSVTVNELLGYTESIYSLLGDGQTYASASYFPSLFLKDMYPFLTDGYSLKAVNGMTAEDLLKEKKELFSFETESWGLSQLNGCLASLQWLDYLGFSAEEGIEFTFENAAGESASGVYYADDFVVRSDFDGLDEILADYMANPGKKPAAYYTVDEEKSLAVLTLVNCDYTDEYVKCLNSMFTEVKEKGIGNVAVDVRIIPRRDSAFKEFYSFMEADTMNLTDYSQRPGFSSTLVIDRLGRSDLAARELLRYLGADSYNVSSFSERRGFHMTDQSDGQAENEKYSDLTFDGRLFVLTSEDTFTSGMLIAQYIKDNGLGTVIGAAPGHSAGGFGDKALFALPNSGIMVSVSTKRFFRADSEAEDLVTPEVSCPAEKALEVLYDTIGG